MLTVTHTLLQLHEIYSQNARAPAFLFICTSFFAKLVQQIIQGHLTTLPTQLGYPTGVSIRVLQKTNLSRLLTMLLTLSIIEQVINQNCQKSFTFRVKNIVKNEKKHKTKLDVRFFERNYPCGSIPSLRRKNWPHNSFQYLQDHFFLLSMNLFKKKIKWRQNKLQSNLKWWYTKTFIFHWVSYW